MPRSMTLTMICSTVVVMRLPPGGGAGDEKRLAVLEHDRRRHRRQRPLAGTGRIGLGADKTIGVRRIGFGCEIVELVVEEDAGALGDQPDAIAEIERIGI